MFVKLLAAAALALSTPPPSPGTGGNSSAVPPPVVLSGARSVSTRNDSGGFQRDTTIPTASAFSLYAGGKAATCSFVADRDDFELSNGTRVASGTVVTSNYLFIEGITVPVGLPLLTPSTSIASEGPLENATRTFTVYCDRTRYDVNSKGVIEVPLLDAFLNPRPSLDNLRDRLQLDRPQVFTNPIVDTYGGLVTRYPTWLAIHPDAWRTQRSPAQIYRGTTLLLIAEPRELNFTVVFTPKAGTATRAYRGDINCIPDLEPTADDRALPAFPVLPDQTEPGPNGPCMWTPPGPGTVTITANIAYTITFWADGYTEPDDDYIFSSAPTIYNTGELIAVNTKP